MMSQLMSKEVLYEPLKELHDKFPSYLEDNASKLSGEDKKRYVAQSKIVAEIVATFEDPSYSDEDPQKGLKVVELMQEMQEHGSPPAEIMGPLPPGAEYLVNMANLLLALRKGRYDVFPVLAGDALLVVGVYPGIERRLLDTERQTPEGSQERYHHCLRNGATPTAADSECPWCRRAKNIGIHWQCLVQRLTEKKDCQDKSRRAVNLHVPELEMTGEDARVGTRDAFRNVHWPGEPPLPSPKPFRPRRAASRTQTRTSDRPCNAVDAIPFAGASTASGPSSPIADAHRAHVSLTRRRWAASWDSRAPGQDLMAHADPLLIAFPPRRATLFFLESVPAREPQLGPNLGRDDDEAAAGHVRLGGERAHARRTCL
ncbi:hypothetical protein NUW54_g13102 [Trametes sanguinea]|uniref:Uncharacterized protein n=1 Tax=Trametes sanguinea TaxID=158606 RepID=A0ACC1MRE6_9APHY|nr:hypothetical protein NUW54_g13102 [Trametes sanguinea]